MNNLSTRENLYKDLDSFIEINAKSKCFPNTIWKATKAYFRGIAISSASYLKRIKEKEMMFKK